MAFAKREGRGRSCQRNSDRVLGVAVPKCEEPELRRVGIDVK
jgi:hypothetical protein